MFPILQLGPLAIQLPGLFPLAGVWVGTWLIDREAPRHEVSGVSLNSALFFGLLAGLVGARLAYAVRYIDIYIQDPLSLFSFNLTAFAPGEGLLIGLAVAFVLGYRRRLPLWGSLDALALPLAAFGIFVGLAHLSSGDAYGAPSSLPWAIDLWGARRHPAQVYEILLAGITFAAVWRLRRVKMFPGFLVLASGGLIAVSQILVDGFRADVPTLMGGLRSVQVAGLVALAITLALLHHRARIAHETG